MHALLPLGASVNYVAKGYNSSREEFAGCGYGIHAEVAAIKHMQRGRYTRGKDRMRNEYDLYVIRLSRIGLLGESKPCINCIQRLRESGIKIRYVYYSTKNRDIVCEKFSQMYTDHVGRARRKQMQNKHQVTIISSDSDKSNDSDDSSGSYKSNRSNRSNRSSRSRCSR